MTEIVMEAHGITKRYGRKAALWNVDVTLQRGHIYGFIGGNGAGKTTFLRIITGQSFPTSGEITLFSRHSPKGLENERRYIGSTIEAPAFFPNETAEKNLDLQRILVGNPDRDIVEAALRVAGLYGDRDKKVKDYSMGMKQRLGIALCLVGNPKMLILDEPINGLDPKGIADLRNMLLKLNKDRKITILLSSHFLNELYMLATDYIIIHKGKIVETLTHDELEMKCQKYISIQMDNTALGAAVLEKELQTNHFKVMEDGMVYLYDYTNAIDTVARVLQENRILVTHIALSEQSLEEYYLKVTGEKENDQ